MQPLQLVHGKRNTSQTANMIKCRAGRIGRVVVMALAMAACVCWGAGAVSAQHVVTVLHVNDTHSHLDGWGPKDPALDGTLGGIARAARVIASERAGAPDALLLHSGDMFQGDLLFNTFFGVPELQLMRQLGFDAMAVGNHEFALGPDVLAAALAAGNGDASLPLLSANLDLSAYPALGQWIVPAIVKEVGGVRIGIFGMTTPDDVMSIPSPVVILGAGDPATVLGIAAQAAAGLREAGADMVICLSHLGVDYDRALGATVPGIDIIVGGHDHEVLSQPLAVTGPEGKSVLVVQAGSRYRYVGKLRVSITNGVVAFVDYELLPVDDSVEPLLEVQAVVDDLKRGVEAVYGDVYGLRLANAVQDIEMSAEASRPWRDTGMGNLITDAFRSRTGTDVAITANGLITGGLFKGPIVGADLFRAVSQGFDPATGLGFKLATFEITGAGLLQALETTLAYADVNDDFFLQVSGLRYWYDAENPPGSRVCPESVRVGHGRLESDRVYTVTVNEAAAMLIPMLGVEVANLQILPDPEYQVLKEHVLAHPHLVSRPEGRIRDMSVTGRRRDREERSPGHDACREHD